jgi:hypothetical protein
MYRNYRLGSLERVQMKVKEGYKQTKAGVIFYINEVETLATVVDEHLKKIMGFVWN